MGAWKSAALSILQVLSANPADNMQMVVTLVLGFLGAYWALHKVAVTMKFPMAESGRSAAILVIGTALLLLAAIAGRLYIAPHVPGSMRVWIPLITAAVIFLVAVVPLAWFMHRSNYVRAMNACLLAIAAGALVILLTKAASDAIRQGSKGFDKSRERTRSIDEVL